MNGPCLPALTKTLIMIRLLSWYTQKHKSKLFHIHVLNIIPKSLPLATTLQAWSSVHSVDC